MSRQLDLVVQGVLGTNPAVTRTAGGRPYCYFRVATSPSFRTAQGWRDGQTIWFTAKSWGPLAENLGRSLHKGDPVVLVGRFSQESWSKGADEFLTNVLTVSCGGHDLTRGESRFMRIVHTSAAEADEAGTQDPSVTTSSSGSAPTADSAPTPDEVSQAVGQTTPEGHEQLPADDSAGAYQGTPRPVEEAGVGGRQAPSAGPAPGGAELTAYTLADEDE